MPHVLFIEQEQRNALVRAFYYDEPMLRQFAIEFRSCSELLLLGPVILLAAIIGTVAACRRARDVALLCAACCLLAGLSALYMTLTRGQTLASIGAQLGIGSIAGAVLLCLARPWRV